MEMLINILFCMAIIPIYVFGIFAVMLLVQLISFRIFKFNLYKWLCYNLIDKYM